RPRFDLQDARHHRMPWEMALEKRLVDCDRFDSNTFRFGVETDDAIDHEKRKTVRQNLHHLVRIESAVAGRHCSRRSHGASARLLAGDCASELRIYGMARLDCHDVAANTSSNEREVAYDVENLVPHELVGKAQRFLA